MVVGLTGGLACGKSLAGSYFSSMGWERIDTDKLALKIMETDPGVRTKLTGRWGESIFIDGTLDRTAVAERVFTNSRELDFLENLLHPLVLREWRCEVEAKPEKKWLVEVPLLFEAGW